MDHIADLVTICTLIISISTIINLVIMVMGRVRAPEQSQNDRISELEKRMQKVEERLDETDEKLRDIEEGNHATHQALLALMSHALDNSDVVKLTEARNRLEAYLIERR